MPYGVADFFIGTGLGEIKNVRVGGARRCASTDELQADDECSADGRV